MGREIARLLSKNGTSLVLHFDVNKTIIMVDPSGGKTQSQVGMGSDGCAKKLARL